MKLTKQQIDLIARQASEGARLQAQHQNERQELMERQIEEREKAGLGTPPPPPPPAGMPLGPVAGPQPNAVRAMVRPRTKEE